MSTGSRQFAIQIASSSETSSYVLRNCQVDAALVVSRVDYCNAAFAGLPSVTLSCLQRVIKAATRLMTYLWFRDGDEIVTMAASTYSVSIKLRLPPISSLSGHTNRAPTPSLDFTAFLSPVRASKS